MTYTILDLEWDSTYYVPEKRFINQILQIGAVKLDESFNITDTFEQTVKSSISKKVSGRFSELTGITSEDMQNGIPLEEAVKKYNDWLSPDTVTMTWSNSDLYTVVQNEKALLSGIRFKIEKYVDLQSFIQNEIRLLGFAVNSQISLSDAAEKLGVDISGFDMHTAKDDSLVCAALLKKYYNKERFEPLIRDTSENHFFKRISYKTEYISDISDKDINKSDLEFYCGICGKAVQLRGKWRYKNHCFFAMFACEDCAKKYSARVSFKRTFDGITVKKKISEYHKKRPMENKNELQSVSEKV